MYDNIQFPLSLERYVSTVEGRTRIIELSNGEERRIAEWADGRVRFNVVPGIRSLADLRALLKFYRCRAYAARSFPIRDLLDYEASWDGTTMAFAIGDGTAGPFQLTKTYSDSANSDVRTIKKPEQGTVKLFVGVTEKTETTHYTIDYQTGLVTFTAGNFPAAAAVIGWTGRFFVPVRFLEDQIPADEIYSRMVDNGSGLYLPVDAVGSIPPIWLIEDRAA